MKQLMLKGFLNSVSLTVFILLGIFLCLHIEQYVPMIAFSLSLLVVISDAISFYEEFKKAEK